MRKVVSVCFQVYVLGQAVLTVFIRIGSTLLKISHSKSNKKKKKKDKKMKTKEMKDNVTNVLINSIERIY